MESGDILGFQNKYVYLFEFKLSFNLKKKCVLARPLFFPLDKTCSEGGEFPYPSLSDFR